MLTEHFTIPGDPAVATHPRLVLIPVLLRALNSGPENPIGQSVIAEHLGIPLSEVRAELARLWAEGIVTDNPLSQPGVWLTSQES